MNIRCRPEAARPSERREKYRKKKAWRVKYVAANTSIPGTEQNGRGWRSYRREKEVH
jgi:hypothetical protein